MIDTANLIVNSLMSGIAIYLTYRIFSLMKVLKTNVNAYNFGSPEWWHCVQHASATAVCFIGSFGLSIVNVVNTSDNIANHESNELVSNLFIILIMLSAVMLVNHMRAEETTNIGRQNKDRRQSTHHMRRRDDHSEDLYA